MNKLTKTPKDPKDPNPTIAKDIAIYFFEKKDWKITPSAIKIQISHAKQLLKAGFTFDEIVYGIDEKYKTMYSLGYLFSTLNKILDEKNVINKQHKYNIINIKEGGENNNSTENNQRKMERFNDESRFRKKHNFDLFKEPRDDN